MAKLDNISSLEKRVIALEGQVSDFEYRFGKAKEALLLVHSILEQVTADDSDFATDLHDLKWSAEAL